MPDLLDQLVELARQGNPVNDAPAALGIDTNTRRPRRQHASERPGSIFDEFHTRISRAEAESSTIDVEILHEAAAGTRVERRAVTKRELRILHGAEELFVTEETVTVVETPPDLKWGGVEARTPQPGLAT